MAYILLSSVSQDQQATRAFSEFNTRDELAKTVISYFEDYLENVQQLDSQTNSEGLEYTGDDLFDFVDQFFAELVCLERQADVRDLWIPYSTSWVKEAIYLYLKKQCENQEKEEEPQVNGIADEYMEVECA